SRFRPTTSAAVAAIAIRNVDPDRSPPPKLSMRRCAADNRVWKRSTPSNRPIAAATFRGHAKAQQARRAYPATRNRSTPAARSRNHGLVRDFESLFTPTLHNAHEVSCGPVHARDHQPCYTNLVQLLPSCPASPTASPLRYAAGLCRIDDEPDSSRHQRHHSAARLQRRLPRSPLPPAPIPCSRVRLSF